jgi:hypothetical protein
MIYCKQNGVMAGVNINYVMEDRFLNELVDILIRTFDINYNDTHMFKALLLKTLKLELCERKNGILTQYENFIRDFTLANINNRIGFNRIIPDEYGFYDVNENELIERIDEKFNQLKLLTKPIPKQSTEEEKDPIEKKLDEMGYGVETINTEVLAKLLGEQYNVPTIKLSELDIEKDIIDMVHFKIAHRYKVIPISKLGGVITIATADPSKTDAIDDIQFLTEYMVEVVVASLSDIEEALKKYYPC